MVLCCGSMTHFYDKQAWGILTYQKLRWHYSRHGMMFLVSLCCWPLFFSSCLLWSHRVLSLDLIPAPLTLCLEDRTVTALEANTTTSSSAHRSQDICTFRVFDIDYNGSSNNIGVGVPTPAQLRIPMSLLALQLVIGIFRFKKLQVENSIFDCRLGNCSWEWENSIFYPWLIRICGHETPE